MAGLGPAIHVFAAAPRKDVDARHKAGHDDLRARQRRGPSPNRFRPPYSLVKQPISFPRRMSAPGLLHLCFAKPRSRGGGAPIRRPYILTLPQVAPGYFKGLDFPSCAVLTVPLPSL